MPLFLKGLSLAHSDSHSDLKSAETNYKRDQSDLKHTEKKTINYEVC